MKQDSSAKRQNEILAEFFEFARTRANTERDLVDGFQQQIQQIKTKFAARKQEATRALLRQHDDLENEYEGQLVANREESEVQTAAVQAEWEEKTSTAKEAAKAAIGDGEYDWFLAKQRSQKEFDADKLAAEEAYRAAKGKLKQQGVRYNALASSVKAALAKHRCTFKLQGGDLLEDPGEGDHLAAHHQTYGQVEELIRQFRRAFWVKFQEDRWFLISFLLVVVMLTYPLHLLLRNIALTGVATAVAGTLCTIIAWFVGRSLAKQTASQFHDSFVTAIAAGKEQLLAAQHQNKRRRDSQLNVLAKQSESRQHELDSEWRALQAEIQQRLQRREDELTTWANKRNTAIQQAKQQREQQLGDQYLPELQKLEHELRRTKEDLASEENAELAACRAQYEARLDELAGIWSSEVAALSEQSGRMRQLVQETRVEYPDFGQWKPPGVPPKAIQFGSVNVDLRELPGATWSDRFASREATFKFPAALDLVHEPSIVIDSTAKTTASRVQRAIMLRLLTSVPPGKVRFTIIDPIGLGQDFSAFMHLADYDEQLVNFRIWTEFAHINARLSELTQHMENIIQTYLRNEFATIQEYNEHAGEVAEAFRVLVVANFPAGFTDESARRLLSIVTSGPRCGVYTLLSLDRQQSLPKNLDLDEFRQHASFLVADESALRWAEPPLSAFPIQLDELPDEETCSRIMHAVGREAKDASHVEVPFSVVAPNESEWWTGDSRGGLSAPLGQAGATKRQLLQLGRGTSQHVLISGKTGSGKSTLLHALITNLALTYSPDELQFYLIDFKKGVEFKAYAEHHLPHARVIAIESEREFGQSVLQRLDVELRRRGDLFRRVGVQSLAGYRDARPDEFLPRIMLVIDEFQEFFVKEDKISQEASLLLDRLVRQGRAFGIHVLLGSQTLAGAYSLARATIGQMAVRIALQCSGSDAHLILSDDNDAARLLRRPGEAIYNDANGLIEGNHPFQVVWLSDVEKEHYLRKLADRQRAAGRALEPAIVFEGNITADISRNELLQKSWASPAPQDIPLAPRAWLGEAMAIKEAPAVVFHRRSGANLLLVGQQEEAALGVLAGSCLSLAAFSPVAEPQRFRFVVLDGTRPESTEAGYWSRLKETSGIEISIFKPKDAAPSIDHVHAEVVGRRQRDEDQLPAIFLIIYNLSRFRELQKGEEDFGFGQFGEKNTLSAAEQLADILRDGPALGVHSLIWSDTYTNLMRWIDRQSLRDIEARVLLQMSATDSSNLMDSSAAAQLGQHRAIFYSEDQGRAERFRPYGLPADDFLLKIRSLHGSLARRPTSAN